MNEFQVEFHVDFFFSFFVEVYAAIRGVSRKDLPRVINTYLHGLHIAEHANKQTQHCSGGTRRKLSYAMAMVGSPKVVLLDE